MSPSRKPSHQTLCAGTSGSPACRGQAHPPRLLLLRAPLPPHDKHSAPSNAVTSREWLCQASTGILGSASSADLSVSEACGPKSASCPASPYLAWMPAHSMCCRWTTSGCFLMNSPSGGKTNSQPLLILTMAMCSKKSFTSSAQSWGWGKDEVG